MMAVFGTIPFIAVYLPLFIQYLVVALPTDHIAFITPPDYSRHPIATGHTALCCHL